MGVDLVLPVLVPEDGKIGVATLETHWANHRTFLWSALGVQQLVAHTLDLHGISRSEGDKVTGPLHKALLHLDFAIAEIDFRQKGL